MNKPVVARALAAARTAARSGSAAPASAGAAVAELQRVPGLGPTRSQRLHDELGVRTLEQLEEALDAGAVRGLPGFSAAVERNVAAALHAMLHGRPRLPLDEADVHVERLLAYMERAPGVESVEVAGSCRRRCAEVSDIDLLATSPGPAAVMRYFTTYADAASARSTDASRGALTLHCGVRVELRIVPRRCHGATLHYLTGSAAYNDAIRAVGLDRGVRISEYGVFQLDRGRAGARRLGGQREADIFAALGMPWLPPELRENRGEIEAALAQRLPQLITQQDVRGDLHLRTRWGDGAATIEEMVLACREAGYSFCAIADVSGSTTSRGGTLRGVSGRTLREQAAEIAALRRRLPGMHILHGIEVAILPDGELDVSDEDLDVVDLVIAAVHSHTRMSGTRMTERLLRAVAHPRLDILARPTGRVLGEREPWELELDVIAAAAASNGVALELSADPRRPDPSDLDVRRSAQPGTVIAIGTGAGAPGEVANMRFGIDQARRGWLEAGNVLNTRGWDGLLHWLRRRERGH